MKDEKIAFVVIIVLIVFVGVLLGRNDSLKSEIQDLSEKYNQISVENDELIDEIEFEKEMADQYEYERDEIENELEYVQEEYHALEEELSKYKELHGETESYGENDVAVALDFDLTKVYDYHKPDCKLIQGNSSYFAVDIDYLKEFYNCKPCPECFGQ